jgi:hypothetical protein
MASEGSLYDLVKSRKEKDENGNEIKGSGILEEDLVR